MAKIKGIDTDHIDEAVINDHLVRYGISCTGKLNRKLRILATHIAEMKGGMTEQEFDSCTCSQCGGESPGLLDQCPFCGDSDTVFSDDATVEPTQEQEAAEPEPTPEPEAPKKELKSRSAAKKNVGAKKKAPSKKVLASKRRKPPEGEVVDEATGEVVETGTAIAVVNSTVPSQFGEVDLNQSIAKCRTFMVDATLECYRLGQELNYICDNNLYLLRSIENGKSQYTSFKVFVRNEFGMAHQQAYLLMGVAKNFTEDQVRQIGTTKLNLALKVPPEYREEILAKAQEGETMVTLSERADALLNKAKSPKALPVGKQLTAIIAMGLMEAPMYKAPTQPGKVGAATSPASQINDEPFAVFTLENGVEATFQVLKDEGGNLVASLAFRRGDVA
jgi:hypothetical protein